MKLKKLCVELPKGYNLITSKSRNLLNSILNSKIVKIYNSVITNGKYLYTYLAVSAIYIVCNNGNLKIQHVKNQKLKLCLWNEFEIMEAKQKIQSLTFRHWATKFEIKLLRDNNNFYLDINICFFTSLNRGIILGQFHYHKLHFMPMLLCRNNKIFNLEQVISNSNCFLLSF